MSRPTKLDQGIESWRREHPAWDAEGLNSVQRTFELASFPLAVGFVVRLGMLAEKHNHHPDIDIRFNRVTIRWTTHDAGGLTRLDLALAEATDTLVG